jgi:hypothetical protein
MKMPSISSRLLRRVPVLLIGAALAGGLMTPAHADERQSLEELRNTVINLLNALVEQGVISREKAQQLVKQAQEKAAADAAALAKSDEGAVRVPYVPEMVKNEIAKQVAEQVKPTVVADVVQQAKLEQWGIPAALPEWLKQTRLYGSVLVREEGLLYSGANVEDYYLNPNAVNAAGGIQKAGINAFIDTNVNRWRTRAAARFGLETDFSSNWSAGIRLSSGNTSDLVSPTQTLDGTPPYAFGVDNLYVRFEERNAQKFPWFTAIGGRFTTPWFTPTDLLFHKQLNFNGVALTGRLGFGDGSAEQSNAFLTVGAMPIQEVALSAHDKVLYGAQLGTKLRFTEHQSLRLAAGYFDFMNYEGRENPPFQNIYDYTAPQFFRTGNTLFDIRNDLDQTTNLLAVASKFRIVDVNASYDLGLGAFLLRLNAEGVKNFGFNEAEIFTRTGVNVAPRIKGYQAEISFGTPSYMTFGGWRALAGYRYLQRDAVIDAYTDSDFHFGGTDAMGYYVTGDLGLANRVWLRLRYLSSNAIDGPTYGVDTVQLDINTVF